MSDREFQPGTAVWFERRSQDRAGFTVEWAEVGTVIRADGFTYLLRGNAGGTFVRQIDQVQEVRK